MKIIFPLVLSLLFPIIPSAALDVGALTQLIRSYEGGGIEIGAVAYSLTDEREIFSYKKDRPLNPASNIKVLTTATALSRLGPGFTFKTHFYSDGPPWGGQIKNLSIRGMGDPSLVQERLMEIAAKLSGMGIREIVGDIIIDQSFFDAHSAPGKNATDDPMRAYSAQVTPLALNFNSFAVEAAATAPGQKAVVAVDPPCDYFELKSSVVTGGGNSVSVSRRFVQGKEVVTVRGTKRRGVPTKIYRSVTHPSLYFGSALKLYLEENGVVVLGQVREREIVPSHLLLEWDSKPLSLVIQDLNKFSNNFTAEMIVKTMGAVIKGGRGTVAQGVEVVREYLDTLGIPRSSYVMENGSGLSRQNRISASILTTVLVDMVRRPTLRNDFKESLAIAGVDGTVQHRLKKEPLVGKLRVKTGTLNDVSSLSGYLPTARGELIAFAIIASGPGAGSANFHTLQQKVALQLASY